MPTPQEDIVATRPISDDEVLIAVAERHRFAQMVRVPVTELSGQPMVLFPKALSPVLSAAFRRWLTDHIGAELNVVAEEPFEQAAVVVASSDSIVAFGNSRWALAIRISGVVYRPMTPAPITSFGIAYRRDEESPHVVNLLEIVDEVRKRWTSDVPQDGELIAR